MSVHRMILMTLCLALSVLGASSSRAEEGGEEADDPRLVEARERIAAARELGRAQDYESALVEFQRAWDLLEGYPLRHFVDYNIAICYERLFRYDQALERYRRYLEVAGPDAEDRGEVLARIEQFEQRLATIHLEVNVESYEVWVDGMHIGDDLSRLLVPGGVHEIEIRASGHVPAQREVNAPARSEERISLDLERLARAHRAWFWASTGLSLASLVAGIAVGVVAMREHERFTEMLDDQYDRWAVTEEDNERVSDLALTADLLYGAAGLFAVTSIVLAFLTDWGGRSTLTPSASASGAGLTIGGTF